MRKGVAYALYDGLVQFDFFSLKDQIHIFVQIPGHVAHNTGKLVEHVSNRLHACEHNGFLKLRGNKVEGLCSVLYGTDVLLRNGPE